MSQFPVSCQGKCPNHFPQGETRLVVLTGGPGAGKTAILEMLKKTLCDQVAVLPEAASIIFGGGFWRLDSPTAKLAAQKAIFHVQRQLEEIVVSEKKWTLALCDRGTLDGLAYWPASEDSFWSDLGTTKLKEFNRYQAVIHLRSPSEFHGYNNQNPLRTETALEARQIDERIHKIWMDHPHYRQIASTANFLEKAQTAVRLIGEELPSCCRVGLTGLARTADQLP